MYGGFGWGKLMEREHLEDLGIDGRIIFKGRRIKVKLNLEEVGWAGMDWIDVA